MFSPRLREELSRMVAGRRSASHARASVEPPGPPNAHAPTAHGVRDRAGRRRLHVRETVRAPAGVGEYLPGGVVETNAGPVFAHECLVSGFREDAESLRAGYGKIESGTLAPSWERGQSLLCDLGACASRALFLDLETTGLHGSVLFLAGFMVPTAGDFVVRQLFARDYSEEKALLLEAWRALDGCEALVTFNGKSYDVPFLKERAAYHRLDLSSLDAKPHLDLLHWSRRRWRGSVTDCRLKTLEWEICRRRRWGDLPGDQIPGIYHRYVRTGDPYQLVPVFHHNVLDLVTMVELMARMLDRDV